MTPENPITPIKHTPYLDSLGYVIKDTADPVFLINVIDNCLELINRNIDWGEHEGKKRKPCPEQPLLLTGLPIGQYHCPVCLEMQMAAMPHLPPDEDYERMTGQPWPAGYVE